MTDAIDLTTRILREIQAEMRTLRSETALLRRELSGKVGRDEIRAFGDALVTSLSDRMAAFEARLETRLDQTERSIEERLIRIEAKLNALR